MIDLQLHAPQSSYGEGPVRDEDQRASGDASASRRSCRDVSDLGLESLPVDVDQCAEPEEGIARCVDDGEARA